jgi:hypothetical protein
VCLPTSLKQHFLIYLTRNYVGTILAIQKVISIELSFDTRPDHFYRIGSGSRISGVGGTARVIHSIKYHTLYSKSVTSIDNTCEEKY